MTGTTTRRVSAAITADNTARVSNPGYRLDLPPSGAVFHPSVFQSNVFQMGYTFPADKRVSAALTEDTTRRITETPATTAT